MKNLKVIGYSFAAIAAIVLGYVAMVSAQANWDFAVSAKVPEAHAGQYLFFAQPEVPGGLWNSTKAVFGAGPAATDNLTIAEGTWRMTVATLFGAATAFLALGGVYLAACAGRTVITMRAPTDKVPAPEQSTGEPPVADREVFAPDTVLKENQ